MKKTVIIIIVLVCWLSVSIGSVYPAQWTDGDKYRVATILEENINENCVIQFIFLEDGFAERYNFSQYVKNIDLRSAQFYFYDLAPFDYTLKIKVYNPDLQSLEKHQVYFEDEQEINLSQGEQIVNVSLKIAQSSLLMFRLLLPDSYDAPLYGENKGVEIMVEYENGEIYSTIGQFIPPYRGSPPQITFYSSWEMENLPVKVFFTDKSKKLWVGNLHLQAEDIKPEMGVANIVIRDSSFSKIGDVGIHVGYEHHKMLAQGINDYAISFDYLIYKISIPHKSNYFIFTDSPTDEKLPIAEGLKIVVTDEKYRILAESTTDSISQQIIVSQHSTIFICIIAQQPGFFRLWVQSE